MNILFICNQNKNRSKTAEHLFKNKHATKSAGLYSKRPLTPRQLSWADLVVVMENAQRSEIAKRFPKHYLQKKIVSLDIPDIYRYNDPKLQRELRSKMSELL